MEGEKQMKIRWKENRLAKEGEIVEERMKLEGKLNQ